MVPSSATLSCAGLLVCTTYLFGQASAGYYMMVDAGSSGSRLRIYKSEGSDLEEVEPNEEDEDKFEVEPGVSAYASNLDGVGPSLKGMLDAAAGYVPSEERADTQLWVKATAGLRIAEASVVQPILDAVSSYLSDEKNCPFNFVSAEALSGDEEAVFAYLAVNNLLGDPVEPTGVLDLGGASTQVAFKPKGHILNYEFHFYANNSRQSVYAKSYTKLGQDTAILRGKELLAADGASASVDFPCFNAGYSETTHFVDRDVNFTGSSEPDKCANLVQSLLHMDYECVLPPCAMLGIHMTPIVGNFYAMSAMYYTANRLGLIGWDEEKSISPGEILKATRKFCSMSMSEAREFQPEQKDKYLKGTCFAGYHVYYILQAYGFTDDDASVTFVRKVAGKTADWSRGAVLYETKLMPEHLHDSCLGTPSRLYAVSDTPLSGPGAMSGPVAPSDMTWKVSTCVFGISTVVLMMLGRSKRPPMETYAAV